jgi:hypothetical protein
MYRLTLPGTKYLVGRSFTLKAGMVSYMPGTDTCMTYLDPVDDSGLSA